MADDRLELPRPEWALDPAPAADRCAEFIRAVLDRSGHGRLVVGLSGGIDSAVAAGLAARAIGAQNLLGILMPYATSSAASVADAQAVAETLGMPIETEPVTPMADAFLAGIPATEKVRRGNVMARCRMIVLYDRSVREQALVLGTGNRTEGLLGYTTMYGDNACALNPVGQLYKTEIRLLSRWLGLPEALLRKAPSADLWEGQADEDELGVTYAEVDRLLHHMVDRGLGRQQLASLGFAPDLVDRIARRVRGMAFKRQTPPVAQIPGRVDPDRAEIPALAEEGGGFADGGFH